MRSELVTCISPIFALLLWLHFRIVTALITCNEKRGDAFYEHTAVPYFTFKTKLYVTISEPERLAVTRMSSSGVCSCVDTMAM